MRPLRINVVALADALRRRVAVVAGSGGRDRGSAVVEFIFLAVLMLIPIVYFILTVGRVQGASYAVVGAADQASRVYAAAEDPGTGATRAKRAAMLAVTDYGLGADAVSLQTRCAGGPCLSAGSSVTVTVSLAVPLPLIPVLPGVDLAATTVSASATQIIGRFG